MTIMKFDRNASANAMAEVVRQAVSVLKAGGLVIFPTETTYGAGVDATNPSAVEKLLRYKARREGKPLSIAVTDIEMAQQFVEVNDSARRLYERFLPGPVTVVSKSLGVVAPGVASEFGTLGVRIPAYPLVLEMVKALGAPITATSANASGEKRPYVIDDIMQGLSDAQRDLLDLVIDAGTLPPNPPSTVIDTTLSTPTTLRQGELQLAPELHHQTTLKSVSETETKAIAARLMLKYWDKIKERGLVIGLDGSLGVGKTIFAKGVAEFLGIKDTITSPTYTYIEEYDFERHSIGGKLFHLDLWKVGSAEELERLEVPSLVAPKQVVVIEWVNNAGELGKNLKTQQKDVPLVHVLIEEITDNSSGRQLTISEES